MCQTISGSVEQSKILHYLYRTICYSVNYLEVSHILHRTVDSFVELFKVSPITNLSVCLSPYLSLYIPLSDVYSHRETLLQTVLLLSRRIRLVLNHHKTSLVMTTLSNILPSPPSHLGHLILIMSFAEEDIIIRVRRPIDRKN